MYNDIITKIEEFDTIVIARHIGVDPDALCSQLALRDSIKLTFPEKKVLAIGTGSAKFTQLGRLDKIEKVQVKTGTDSTYYAGITSDNLEEGDLIVSYPDTVSEDSLVDIDETYISQEDGE